jgi:hypothetical protein
MRKKDVRRVIMAEEFSNEAEATGTGQPKAETRQAWEEVGHQFEQLGHRAPVRATGAITSNCLQNAVGK